MLTRNIASRQSGNPDPRSQNREQATMAFSKMRFLQCRPAPPTSEMSLGTMNINALVINGSDPGAVPGDSTNILHLGIMGSK